jgi:cobalamin synthase
MSQPDREMGRKVETIVIVVFVIAPLVGIIVGGVASLLASADGKSIPSAIPIGGSVLAGSVTLILLILAAGGRHLQPCPDQLVSLNIAILG